MAGSRGGEANGRGEGPDPPRLLAARSQYGYTDEIHRALRDEPEAVTSSEQEGQTLAAHRRDLERQREYELEMWSRARRLLAAGVQTFRPVADQPSASDLRVVTRIVEKIDRRLAAQ